MAKAPTAKPKTVPMARGDQKADVHPDEVDNWKRAGWSKAEK